MDTFSQRMGKIALKQILAAFMKRVNAQAVMLHSFSAQGNAWLGVVINIQKLVVMLADIPSKGNQILTHWFQWEDCDDVTAETVAR